MKLADFTYNLPPELIAAYPPKNRSDSRLLEVVGSNNYSHKKFSEIVQMFNSGDLLVLNNTKVIPARFYGKKPTGAKIEFLLERVVSENTAIAYIKSNRSPKAGTIVNLEGGYTIKILDKNDSLYCIELQNTINWYTLLDKIGQVPLPPYINRLADSSDLDRYQTVYASSQGAVAAPTAGLHFSQELLTAIQNKGVNIQYLTLHVGSGTFAPVRVDNIKEHKMHSERFAVSEELLASIINLKNGNESKQLKNKIVAIGTTSLRCLESLSLNLDFSDNDFTKLLDVQRHGETDIFIYPGFKFKLVDSLITNFHLPGSTLMMLVSAFAGLDVISQAYQQAISNRYKFYSYGDAMWLNSTENCTVTN